MVARKKATKAAPQGARAAKGKSLVAAKPKRQRQHGNATPPPARRQPSPAKQPTTQQCRERAAYAKYRESKATERRQISAAGREIGEIPPVADPARREACRLNLRLFLETYFPETFTLGWSPDHLLLIDKAQLAVLTGGLFAFAMPRGSGKTSISERVVLWAVLYGHHEFVCLIGATGPAANEMFEAVRTELETNELLAADFPEVCYPIQCLGGISQRRLLHKGEPVTMAMRKGRILLPDIPGSVAGAAIITVASMTSRIRGMKFARTDGRTVRPSFVLPDDPQTDESAASESQCDSRERTLAGAVLGLAGPGQKISGLMPCTVIRKGDVADRILDQKKHPEWSGERRKLIYKLPASTRWDGEYAEVYREGLRTQDGNAAANAYYRTHRAEMDSGAEVAWEERFKPDEVSAVQHAMNWKLRDERAFWAEAQNEPQPEANEVEVKMATADELAAKVNNVPLGIVPVEAQRLTLGIDVHGELLYWLVAAWGENFSGSVVAYGAWPQQPAGRDYFTLRDATATLATQFPAAGVEGRIYAGLRELFAAMLGREWRKPNGQALRIERALVDANWGTSTSTVFQACRESEFAAVLTPSHGRGIGASSQPVANWNVKADKGETRGLNWVLRVGERGIKFCSFDTNWWKSFVHSRLGVAMGDRGCLNFCGDRASLHRMLADHLTAEFYVTVEAKGRKVDEWKLRPNCDNHLFDALVMATVAASVQGAALKEAGGPAAVKPRARVKWSEVAAAKRTVERPRKI